MSKRLSFVLLVLSFFFQLSNAQNIKHPKFKRFKKTPLPVLHVLDYKFSDIDSGIQLGFNENGDYLYSDSTLVNAILCIYLTKEDDASTIYGWYCGKIINGKREGEWQKEIYIKKQKRALVQRLNYASGLLHGKCYSYDINSVPLKLDVAFCFGNGNGQYFEFYDTGELKQIGYLKNGIKKWRWTTFDKEGNVIKINTFSNGVSILD